MLRGMNKDHEIYELTEAQKKAMLGERSDDSGDGYDDEQAALLREDVSRLDGYLKGRSDSDRAQMSRPNGDLTHRKSSV